MVSPAINPTSPPRYVYKIEIYSRTQNGTTPETSSNNVRNMEKVSAQKPRLLGFPDSNFSPGLWTNATVASELLFKHVIAFLKANTKVYNLFKIHFKKRYYLRDMCAQSFLIKFERQSTLLYFIAHCSRLINTINKCDNFLES